MKGNLIDIEQLTLLNPETKGGKIRLKILIALYCSDIFPKK